MSCHIICHVSSCLSIYFDLMTFGLDIESEKVIRGWVGGRLAGWFLLRIKMGQIPSIMR